MGCLGVHFAITADQAGRLLSAKTAEARSEIIFDEIEERDWGARPDYPWVYETDKAWDAIHRCLTDGTLESGQGSLAEFILGGKEILVHGYLVFLVTPAEAREAAMAAAAIDESWIRDRYFRLATDDVGYRIDEDDFQYTWAYFRGLPAFFKRAADAARWILFTASQ